MPADSQSIKFDLFVKVREVNQVYDILQKILLKSRTEQKRWARENHIIIEDMMDSFMNDSFLVLDGMQLDEESMQLSMDLMEKLRSTMSIIQDLLPS